MDLSDSAIHPWYNSPHVYKDMYLFLLLLRDHQDQMDQEDQQELRDQRYHYFISNYYKYIYTSTNRSPLGLSHIAR